MSWSLAAIADAVEPFLYQTPFTISRIRTMVNHIWFAYTCHHAEVSSWLPQEDALLSG